MSNQPLAVRVHDQLAKAIASGLLPQPTQEQAEKLLAHMQQPVRLAVLGRPQTGKSSIVNLLVGADVLPDGVRLPTLQMVYGAEESTTCTLPDGSKQTFDGVDATAIAAKSPVFVQMAMPLPALGKISILEVVAPDDPNALHRASQWASKRADVVLWCTSEFDDDERRIWSQMPDIIKDHAIMMITRMDVLRAHGTLDGVVGAARTAGLGEFDKFLPINVPLALAARNPDGSVDKDVMRSSGGSAMISAVLKQVAQGKRSTIDMAEVLLLQNADALVAMEDEAADTAEAPAPEPPAPFVDTAAAPEPKAEPDVPEVSEQITDGIAKLRSIAARRSAERESNTVSLHPETRAAYEHVLDRITGRAEELAGELDRLGESAPSEIMDECVNDLQWLCDYLNDHGDPQDEPLQRARDTAYDAADLVQLMQLEKRDSAALEAVSLMLQVKHELQADLAA